jgi:hypothetical protein
MFVLDMVLATSTPIEALDLPSIPALLPSPSFSASSYTSAINAFQQSDRKNEKKS